MFPNQMTIKTKQPNTSQKSDKWAKILKAIPGYDPYETAGDCTFDDREAEKALGFFRDCLVFIEGEKAGQPFHLELWQQSIVANLFGWKRPDGTRRYRESFVYVPRKNGKTPLCAGIVLYGLFCDGEPGAQIYSAAADREQAALTYRHAAGMIARNPAMQDNCKVYRTFKSIEYPATTSIYKALSHEADTKHGLNAHLVIVDELHAHPDGELIDVLATSTASRTQPLIIYITTADYDRESECNNKHEYACRVRDGIVDDVSFLPVVYETLQDEDWTDPKIWQKANPNLSVSVSREYLERECKRAQEVPSTENRFKRLHLNMKTEQDVRWLGIDHWDGGNIECTEDDLAGQLCFGGCDLSSNTDTTSLVWVFPQEDGTVKVLPRIWIPAEGADKREKNDKVPYSLWVRQGHIRTTPGNVVDYEYIQRDIESDWQKFNVAQMAFDRWNFEALRQRLASEGVDEEKLISFGQGFVSMSPAMKELERLLLGKYLLHNDNPAMRWMFSNIAVEMDTTGNVKPSKKKSKGRIDAMVSLIMAVGMLAIHDQDDGRSVYEDRGLVIL